MRVFVDTNILLDVLMARSPFVVSSARVWRMTEQGRLDAYISAISFNNILYIARKLKDTDAARNAMRRLRDVFRIVDLDQQTLHKAIDDDAISDFEDAIQFHSAVRRGCVVLLTRNPDHFPSTGPAVATPDEFLASPELTI